MGSEMCIRDRLTSVRVMERGDVGFELGLIEKGGPHLGVGLLLADGVRHRAVGIGARREERRAGGGRSRGDERGPAEKREETSHARKIANATDGRTARTQNQRKRGRGEEKSCRETPRPGRKASLDMTTAIIIDGRIKNKKNTTETKRRARINTLHSKQHI